MTLLATLYAWLASLAQKEGGSVGGSNLLFWLVLILVILAILALILYLFGHWGGRRR